MSQRRSDPSNRKPQSRNSQPQKVPHKSSQPKQPKDAASRSRKAAGGQTRALIVFGLFVVLALIASGRLAYLQIAKADEFTKAAKAQRTRDIKTTPRRGTIYDRNGEVLAVSAPAVTVYANPRQVKDKATTAEKLAAVLGGKVEDYDEKLAKDAGFVYIKRQVDPEVTLKLETEKLPGVFFLEDTKRVYPGNKVGGQILGFVDPDGIGQAGLEMYYDELLRGEPGELIVERGQDGTPIPDGIVREEASVEGQDILISIDKSIQEYTESQLATAVAEFGAKDGSAVVMSTKTGEIYAIASTPYFNPNKYTKAKPENMKLNAITDAYEPGSTAKVATVSGALDKGVVKPGTKFYVPFERTIYDQKIHDAHSHESSTLTVRDIIVESSNIGTTYIADKLGKKSLYNYFSAFGFAQKPGVDFPGATRGSLAKLSTWSGTTYANVAFGQEFAISALQLARGVSTVANDGIITTPHFLVDTPGKDYFYEWPTRYVVSAQAADKVNSILVKTADKGTGGKVKVPGYTVAGKTGTAQKSREGSKGYTEGAYVSSFVGYLPAEDPELLVYVVLDEPSNGYYGVTVATGAFNNIAKYAAERLQVPSSKTIKEKTKAAGGK